MTEKSWGCIITLVQLWDAAKKGWTEEEGLTEGGTILWAESPG